MIETRNWLYVVAKHKGGCECFRGRHQLRNNLIDTQRQYLRKRRLLQPDPTPKVWKCDTGNLDQKFIHLKQGFKESDT